ncbi:alpha/beta hydrolase [Pseudarthrobacter sp. efr-133-R2A-89]|uniref:alpha/beta fold hydrolase n=1 Tax=Pseudarthrobacter sp. efr-133-R2A-89 TaxID=3040302 RepID=UPI0025560E32|nr:alpha/beta hydrolase [Pseudarthrobacter sp. efr-133-R2A-89]
MKPFRVILLPGSVLPAGPAYDGLLEALGPDADAIAKDLELYAGDAPPPGWTLDTEADGVLGEADARGWDTFHLVGYSGGGAASLALTASHPGRVRSLALLEPAWAGNWDWSPAHTELWKRYGELSNLPQDEFLPAFMKLQVKPDAVLPPPPPGPPPPWMAKRPAGIGAFLHEFGTYDLDRGSLAAFAKPVLFVLGGMSSPDEQGDNAERLSRVFRDYRLEVFPGRHHFDPPHRAEPGRVAGLLLAHWGRAENAG